MSRVVSCLICLSCIFLYISKSILRLNPVSSGHHSLKIYSLRNVNMRTHMYVAYSIIVWTHPNEHKTIYPLFRCATHALILIIIAVQTNLLLSYILHALFGTAGCCFSNFLLALTHQISNEISRKEWKQTNNWKKASNQPPNLTIRCFLI